MNIKFIVDLMDLVNVAKLISVEKSTFSFFSTSCNVFLLSNDILIFKLLFQIL